MRKTRVLAITGFVTLALGSVIAQNAVGQWQMDVAQSDFGSDPKPTAMSITVLHDTPRLFAYRAHRLNRNESPFAFEWSGPKDGSMHHVKIEGQPQTMAVEGVKEEDGVLVQHGVELDGSLMYSRITFSKDWKTMTVDVTWKHYDGTEDKQKWLFRRDERRGHE